MRVTRSLRVTLIVLRVTRLPSHDRYFTIFFGLLFGREEKKKENLILPDLLSAPLLPPGISFLFVSARHVSLAKKIPKKYPPTEGERNQTTTKTQKYNPYPKTKTLMIKLHSTKNTEKLFESYATQGKHQSPSVPDTPVRTVT